ncbi:MAG: PAS domain-containing sensor histidine kinase [Candidatus Heimdallarchaeaceae archaeon]
MSENNIKSNISEVFERYKLLFETANDCIFLLNKENVFIECNPKTLDMFNCKKEDIIGKTPMHFSPVKQPDGYSSEIKAKEVIIKAFNGEPQRFEWVHTRKDGSTFYAEVSLNITKLRDEYYLQAIVRDISERIYKREIEELYSSLVDHDVRNLLQSSSGFICLVLESEIVKEKNKIKDYLIKSLEKIQTIERVLDDFHQFREIYLQRKVETIQLKQGVLQGIEMLKDKIEEKNVALELDISDEIYVQAGRLISTMFRNLLDNSLTHSNCTKISIKAKEVGQRVQIVLEDNGNGIPPDLLENIFCKNFKSKQSKGLGLGLYIVKKIACSYDGEIEAYNSAHGGAKFIIFLKKVKSDK